MNLFFTSDNHFGHENIIQHCHRPFKTADEMDQHMIDQWNSVVTNDDEVFHLGDLSHKRCPPERTNEILRSLNGSIMLICGNHEIDTDESKLNEIRDFDWYLRQIRFDVSLLSSINPGYHEMRIDGRLVVMSHYGMETWHGSYKDKSYHLHGHCVDTETEILTTEGWKGHQDISVGDATYSLNHKTRRLDQDPVLEVIHTEHTGKVYELNGKSIDFRITNNHTVVSFLYGGAKLRELTADETFKLSTVNLLRAGHYTTKGAAISNALIRLYILMVADASAPLDTGLVRYRVTKERKLDYCRRVLKALRIKYTSHPQSDGSTSLNFYMPQELSGLQVKGMDKDFMRSLTKGQFEWVLDAYRNSDGCANGRGVIIYSSKEEEIDLLQELAVTRGHGATKSYRDNHGFSSGRSFQLSVYPAEKTVALPKLQQRLLVQQVTNEPFWCIRNRNQNFLCRRRGKVHLTGNSHGKLSKKTRRLDVGVDTHDFRPWSWQEIRDHFDPQRKRKEAF